MNACWNSEKSASQPSRQMQACASASAAISMDVRIRPPPRASGATAGRRCRQPATTAPAPNTAVPIEAMSPTEPRPDNGTGSRPISRKAMPPRTRKAALPTKSARASDVTAAGLFGSTITHFDSLALTARAVPPSASAPCAPAIFRIPGARTPAVLQRYGRGGPGPSPGTDKPAPPASGLLAVLARCWPAVGGRNARPARASLTRVRNDQYGPALQTGQGNADRALQEPAHLGNPPGPLPADNQRSRVRALRQPAQGVGNFAVQHPEGPCPAGRTENALKAAEQL